MFYARRTRNLFDPSSSEPFRVSRSKIELFLNCRRCFYLDARMGVPRPSMVPLTLNNAVDALLKKEFDVYRAAGTAHPLAERYGIDAVPFAHADIEAWRDALRRGVTYLHPETNFLITGGVDDVWARPNGELIVVDYKATSKTSEISIDADWQMGYKRQMEIYQWLFRRNGFPVSSTGYFVYVNGKTDAEAFDGKLEFDVKLIPYTGDDAWVPGALLQIRECLAAGAIPAAADECEYCTYAATRARAEGAALRNTSRLL